MKREINILKNQILDATSLREIGEILEKGCNERFIGASREVFVFGDFVVKTTSTKDNDYELEFYNNFLVRGVKRYFAKPIDIIPDKFGQSFLFMERVNRSRSVERRYMKYDTAPKYDDVFMRTLCSICKTIGLEVNMENFDLHRNNVFPTENNSFKIVDYAGMYPYTGEYE